MSKIQTKNYTLHGTCEGQAVHVGVGNAHLTPVVQFSQQKRHGAGTSQAATETVHDISISNSSTRENCERSEAMCLRTNWKYLMQHPVLKKM